MNISRVALKAEYLRAVRIYPDIAVAEDRHGLPWMFLFAVGSRETNLTNEIGDGGHAHGIFSLDDRSHTIPHPFTAAHQAQLAGAQLHSLIVDFSVVRDPQRRQRCAAAAYNCGRARVDPLAPDKHTTGGDYGLDVIERMHALRAMFP